MIESHATYMASVYHIKDKQPAPFERVLVWVPGLDRMTALPSGLLITEVAAGDWLFAFYSGRDDTFLVGMVIPRQGTYWLPVPPRPVETPDASV